MEVAARLAGPDLGRWLAQVEKVRHCETVDPITGEVLASYNSTAEAEVNVCAVREPAGVGVPV